MKWAYPLLILLTAVSPLFAAAQDNNNNKPDAAMGETLTLQKAMSLAYKYNLSLEVERITPEIASAGVNFERAKFEPLFTSNLFGNSSNQPTYSSLTGTGKVNSKNFTYNFGLQQRWKTGTSYNVEFNNARVSTNQLFTTFNPRYSSSLFLSVNQPLMRDFGMGITRAPVDIAIKNKLASDERLRKNVMDIGMQVEQAYWSLVYSRQLLGVVQQSLAYAKDLYENNKKQVEVGTMAPLEVVVAEAQVAADEQEIIQTQALIQNNEDSLRTLIIGKQVTDWDQPIIPVEEPQVVPMSVTEEEAIQRALDANPDLKALDIDFQSRTLSSRLAANALKPQIDLQAQYGYSGLGGERLIFTDDPLNPVVTGTQPGGYRDALTNLWDNRTVAVGVVIGLPIGNGSARASFMQADLEKKQAETTLANAKQQTILSVRTAYRNIESDLKVLDASRVSRVLQEKKLDAERKKLNVGLSTNNVVLDFQQDLARAQATEFLALINYKKDVASLNRLMGATWTGE